MRRKEGILLPIELAILEVCATRALSEVPECHGFLIASLIKGEQNTKLLTAYGTLYRALGRLEKAGYLTSRWEDVSSFEGENRPRRRLYRITAAGSKALASSRNVNVTTPTANRVITIPRRELA